MKILPLEMEAYEEAMSLQKIIDDPTKTYREETVMCVRWWCTRIEHKLTQNVKNAYQLKQNED